MILFVTNLSYFLLQQLSKERNRLQKYINFLIYTRVFLKKCFFYSDFIRKAESLYL